MTPVPKTLDEVITMLMQLGRYVEAERERRAETEAEVCEELETLEGRIRMVELDHQELTQRVDEVEDDADEDLTA